jgi:dipeptidyl aminopeptidase/acylaminoacyl peptidase
MKIQTKFNKIILLCSVVLVLGALFGFIIDRLIETLQPETQKGNDGYIFYNSFEQTSETNYYQLLRVMTPIGQDVEILGSDKENPYHPAWSNDGRYLAIGVGNEVIVQDMVAPRYYRENPFYTKDQNASYTHYIIHDELSKQCDQIIDLDWKPGENRLDLICSKKSTSEKRVNNICTIRFEIDDIQTFNKSLTESCENVNTFLNRDVVGIDKLRWSPDGNQLMVVLQLQNIRDQTYLFDPVTKNIRELFTGIGSAWSPDGKKVTVTNLRSDWGCLAEYDIEKQNYEFLYCPPKEDLALNPRLAISAGPDTDYSPNGEEIVFTAGRDFGGENGTDGIYKINIKTKEVEILTEWSGKFGPSIGPSHPRWQPYCKACLENKVNK